MKSQPHNLLLKSDPWLEKYSNVIERRAARIAELEKRLTMGEKSLAELAPGHEYYGLHFRDGEWVFREWAPNANSICIIGDMTGWEQKDKFRLKRMNSGGDWEIRLPDDSLRHGDLYKLHISWDGGRGDRIPAYARRVVQDHDTKIFNAQVWKPPHAYEWKHVQPEPSQALFIYEAHIGMAQDREGVGSFNEFTENVLPRIVKAGYNAIQLMAVQEHPYYGSFGYQVSSFFAACSRFGTPEEFKRLVDEAHGLGLRVIIDLIHSNAVSNEVEGLSRFDGTDHQYFHAGNRGVHPLWKSRCFDYGKIQVLHFLISNCRFWLDEYRVDGFRFDGVTSMLYHHHGMDKAFASYDDYYDDQTDEDALAYLTLANKMIHEQFPNAVTIAEDVSGMPGLAFPVEKGGYGFDYRFAMGVPDYWIQLVKDVPDENWHMGALWHELTNRRSEEKTISYCECHDQSLVGDQTLIFRLMEAHMYDAMSKSTDNIHVSRGLDLHKLIRLITLAAAGSGYLNFMGNEFGHPEWVDFPREGNGWSYKYARRQWRLLDDPSLRYGLLAAFDRDMIRLAKNFRLLEHPHMELLHKHDDDKVLAFNRGRLMFIFNFHPSKSHTDYPAAAPPGKYQMIFNSDAPKYGGHSRLENGQVHFTFQKEISGETMDRLSLYLPTRTGIVLTSRQ